MEEVTPEYRKRRLKLAIWFWSITAVLVGLGLGIYWLFFSTIKYTDDAYVEGNQVVITPLKEGFVTAIHTDDTFLVQKGQVLVEMDETDSRIALADAEDALANAVRAICNTYHQTFAYAADIEVKRANLIKVAQDYEHRKGVIDVGGVSVENYEHAVAFLREGEYGLKNVESLYLKELALIQGTSIREHPSVKAAAERLIEAWVQLYRCKIYAPVQGLVAQRKVQVGMHVKMGEPLMAVIPLDQIWVNANYKETQMKRMRIGQRVQVTADLYGHDVVYEGKIVGLPGGAGNAFSLLPPQNLSGNWIKIVQRLPVRVELDKEKLIAYPLRIGLTMKAYTDVSQEGGPMVPDSNRGAPHYVTDIYALEVKGSDERVDQIIRKNLDPSLSRYLDHAYSH